MFAYSAAGTQTASFPERQPIRLDGTLHVASSYMIWRRMRVQESERSPELEQLRLMLFPRLSHEDGWRRIETAFERAADRDRSRRIEELARDPDLAEEMLRRIRGLP